MAKVTRKFFGEGKLTDPVDMTNQGSDIPKHSAHAPPP